MRVNAVLRSPALLLTFLAVFSLDPGPEAQAQGKDDPMKVNRHFKIERPAALSKTDALAVYDNIARDMAKGYGASGDPSAKSYLKWRRFNEAPYRSATHGNRYVNNYANPRGAATYGAMKAGETLPAGSVLAKDSFTVTSDSGVFGGALFIMEKLAAGKRPDHGDWRYLMIMPDGSLLGDSTGDNADKVDFCDECHSAVADNDRLFYVPEEFRRRMLGTVPSRTR